MSNSLPIAIGQTCSNAQISAASVGQQEPMEYSCAFCGERIPEEQPEAIRGYCDDACKQHDERGDEGTFRDRDYATTAADVEQSLEEHLRESDDIFTSIRTYADAGIIGCDNGLVIRTADGREFQIHHQAEPLTMCRTARDTFRAERETQLIVLESVELHTKTPCCWQPIRIKALVDVPKEVQDRTCRGCGQRWQVTRKFAKLTEAGRVDILEWEPR